MGCSDRGRREHGKTLLETLFEELRPVTNRASHEPRKDEVERRRGVPLVFDVVDKERCVGRHAACTVSTLLWLYHSLEDIQGGLDGTQVYASDLGGVNIVSRTSSRVHHAIGWMLTWASGYSSAGGQLACSRLLAYIVGGGRGGGTHGVVPNSMLQIPVPHPASSTRWGVSSNGTQWSLFSNDKRKFTCWRSGERH